MQLFKPGMAQPPGGANKMNARFGFVKSVKTFSFFLIVLMPVLFQGCGRDSDTKVVDFSKTVPVKRAVENRETEKSLRVAVGAMISPRESFLYYRQLLGYVGKKLGMKIDLIQRKTYGEINELIGKGKIDLAFICSGPYATGRRKYGFSLLATPQVRGRHTYRAYLIVRKDSPFQRFADLKGKVFAFTDPESNTGWIVPLYWLAQINQTPETFFKKTIFTYSHDNAILAVSRGLVDGACVDGLVWEYYNRKNPGFTANTRVIKRSIPFGIPPLVGSRTLSKDFKKRIRKILYAMHRDPEGQDILHGLLIDRFAEPEEEWYESIRNLHKSLLSLKEGEYVPEKPQG